MRKLNILNKIYIVILVAIIIATVIKTHHYDAGDRYYYTASFTAPPTYRMYVQQSQFITEGDGQNHVFIKSDNVNSGSSTWGNGDSEDTEEQERLPKALVLRYASYREKAFYADTIPLPTKVIDEIFAGGIEKNINVGIYTSGGPELSGLIFLIGIANNGNIVIWLQGRKYERKILTYHLKPIKPTQDQFYESQFYPVKTYFDYFNIDTAGYKKMVKNGIDAHANYADSATHYIENYSDPVKF